MSKFSWLLFEVPSPGMIVTTEEQICLPTSGIMDESTSIHLSMLTQSAHSSNVISRDRLPASIARRGWFTRLIWILNHTEVHIQLFHLTQVDGHNSYKRGLERITAKGEFIKIIRKAGIKSESKIAAVLSK